MLTPEYQPDRQKNTFIYTIDKLILLWQYGQWPNICPNDLRVVGIATSHSIKQLA
jgi:hypothetical protein